eukprot:GHVU01171200.1.p1 GENE.GHVU01171200.1~~GHVU01171200.1.p1  ORF type:complete len:191 (+),score=24.92 GHVU01171200.1:226-798(+)
MFACLTDASKVFGYKFKGWGKSNLASNLQGNKQLYYQSFCEFVKVTRKEKCTMEVLASIGKAPIPVKIIVRNAENKVGYINPTCTIAAAPLLLSFSIGTIAVFAVAAAPLLLSFFIGTIAVFAAAAAPLLLSFYTGTPVADAPFSPVGFLPTGTSPVVLLLIDSRAQVKELLPGRPGNEDGGHRRSRCGA